MARICYVEPSTVTDPQIAGLLEESRIYGTPRLESQAIRAHVPAASLADLAPQIARQLTEPDTSLAG
jgi:hypothetical protein